jgi:hypothetical protein
MMKIENQQDAQLGSVVDMIRSTLGTEIIRATPDHIVFCGKGPRRTFEIRREGTRGFRVEEIMEFQAAGQDRQPASHPERTILNRSQMTEWVSARLQEVQVSSLLTGGLSWPERSAVLMMIASAFITIGSSMVGA